MAHTQFILLVSLNNDLAMFYCLTSHAGSTGTPKGVDVSHNNVTNALLLEPANLGITLGSKVAQVLNIAFDMGKSLMNNETHVANEVFQAHGKYSRVS